MKRTNGSAANTASAMALALALALVAPSAFAQAAPGGETGGQPAGGQAAEGQEGVQATMRGTPATLAVATDICAEATIGNLPPGT